MKTNIAFIKMHGLGNDFVLVDNRNKPHDFSTKQIQHMGNRHTGIGFDQLILINQAEDENCDANYQFFNPDGSQAEQCGNGQRCISAYLHTLDNKKNKFCVNGLAGKMYSTCNPDATVTVDMGGIKSCRQIENDKHLLYHVDFGNPHLVMLQKNIQQSDLMQLHQQYSQQYKAGINLEIAEIINQNHIKIRVFERGTGETLACGSGACAAFYALFWAKQLHNRVKVSLPGGQLVVEYHHEKQNIFLTGATTYVYSGEITL